MTTSQNSTIHQNKTAFCFRGIHLFLALCLFEVLAFNHSIGIGLAVALCLISAFGTFTYKSQPAKWLGIAAVCSTLGLIIDGSWYSLAAALPLTGAYLLARADKLSTQDFLIIRDLLKCFLLNPFIPNPKSFSNAPKIETRLNLKHSWHLNSAIAAWLLPATLSIVFLILFLPANPWLQSGLQSAHPVQWFTPPDLMTVFLWISFFILLQPIFKIERFKSTPEIFGPKKGVQVKHLVGSLILFNAIFALQTFSDLANFWTFFFQLGQEQMAPQNPGFYSSMVHEGAFSLALASFLVAGFITLLMAEKGLKLFPSKTRLLILLWLVQTFLLCLSSFARLHIYVDVFGLTSLRLIVFVATGMVTVGLVLMVPRLYGKRSHEWLIRSNIVLIFLVLNILGTANIDRWIATQQLNRFSLDGTYSRLDKDYLCKLGIGATPILKKNVHFSCEVTANKLQGNVDPWQSWTLISHLAKKELGP